MEGRTKKRQFRIISAVSSAKISTQEISPSMVSPPFTGVEPDCSKTNRKRKQSTRRHEGLASLFLEPNLPLFPTHTNLSQPYCWCPICYREHQVGPQTFKTMPLPVQKGWCSGDFRLRNAVAARTDSPLLVSFTFSISVEQVLFSSSVQDFLCCLAWAVIVVYKSRYQILGCMLWWAG